MKKMKMMVGLVFLLSLPAAMNAQCDSDEFLDECASSLGTHTFVKAFHAESKGKKNTENPEYSYVFSKGSTYMIVVCDQARNGERMIVNLYDRNHKLIASSYDKRSKKYYPDMTYPCPATGVYYLEATFENDNRACGVIILGFSKS